MGLHFLFDGNRCQAQRLGERRWLIDALCDLVTTLGLTSVGTPQSFESSGGRTVAGIVLLSESHASIHVDVAARRVHIDVFSCQSFDLIQARIFCVQRFEPEHFEDRILERNLA